MMPLFIAFLFVLITIVQCKPAVATPFQKLSEPFVKELITSLDRDQLWSAVTALSVYREVGTPEHQKVQQWIVAQFDTALWNFETDQFDEETPLGVKTFTNLVFTEKSNLADERLVIAAHYDSKYFPPDKQQFVGATDSAVPCAYMIAVAKTLHSYLQKQLGSRKRLQFVFFDGEEAFETWTKTDSLYGSRHLANKWNEQDNLSSIEAMAVWDLMGHSGAAYYSTDKSMNILYDPLVQIERKLKKMTDVSTSSTVKRPFFSFRRLYHAAIEDDHKPFMDLQVPILHLISMPFPNTWHTFADDLEHLDQRYTNALCEVLLVWTASYLQLDTSVAHSEL